MKKILFKNNYVNVVLGVVLIALAVVAVLAGWYQEYLPILIGVVILIVSTKRFIFSFKSTNGKYAVSLLILEFVLDIVLSLVLILYRETVITNLALYVGIIIYLRGLTYLLINFMTDRSVLLLPYLTSIGYVTLGSFLFFTSIDIQGILEWGTVGILALVGLIYFYFGLRPILKKKRDKKESMSDLMADKPKVANKVKVADANTQGPTQKPIVTPQEKKPDDSITKKLQDDNKTEPLRDDHTKKLKQAKPIKDVTEMEEDVEEPKPKEKTVNYDSLTVKELQEMAKAKGMSGYSTLNKTPLIKAIKKHVKEQNEKE